MFDRIMCVLVKIKVRGHLVMSIIQFMNLISVHFWTYLHQWQECYRNMAAQVTYVEGIPEDIPSLFPANCPPGILVLDDLMRNNGDDDPILELFTKVSHHCDVTCIYLT